MTDFTAGADQTGDAFKMSRSAGARNRERVRSVFENAPRYFKNRGVDIRFRIDTVGTYASRLQQTSALDIGCGDGTISLPLVSATSRLTLMDLSSSMVVRAKSNIPAGLEDNVEVRNEDFASADFGTQKFDLIVAVGVMAHLEKPAEFLCKIRQLLSPSGGLILEFTDAFHAVGRLGRMLDWLKELVAPAPYSTRKFSSEEVARMFEANGLRVESTFRYSRVPLPGFNMLVNHSREYKLVRAIFGSAGSGNRNAWMGNEYICLLRKV